MLKKLLHFYFSFKGRVSPAFYAAGVVSLFPLVRSYLDRVKGLQDATMSVEYFNIFLFGLFILWIGAALMVRRLHDMNLRFFWMIIPLGLLLVPYAKVLAWAGLIFIPGTPGQNRFGPTPATLRGFYRQARLYVLEKQYTGGKIDAVTYNTRRDAIIKK